ncbi:MAG: murein biosynthesis integral membrane protein MurJ [Elusimicrobia bacterium]|nr:murein biosynthesis integral membrane protein MurJ [Elusimicrobiota bacterium]
MSTNLKIAKASLILAVMSILGNLLSMSKEMLVASHFGVTKAMDAFGSALTVPNYLFNFTFSPFNVIFIPLFIKYKLQDVEEANRITSIAVNYILLFVLFATVVIFMFSSGIIKYGFPGFDYETSVLATKILRIVIVTTVFTGLISVLTGVLNSYGRFLWPAFSQMFITISIILFILFFAKQWGVYVFAWGLLVGLVVQFVFLIPFAKRQGYKYYFDFRWNHPEIKKILKLLVILLFLAILSGINPFINRTMASWLPAGSIAALNYADKLVQVPSIILLGSISTAVYPFLATQISENKIEDMKNTFATSIKMMGFIFIPLAIIMIILAKPTIQVLYQRGAFNSQATDLTSKILICYTIQLFSGYAMVMMQRLFFIYQDMLTLFKVIIVNTIANIILNLIFIKVINPPAAGIALSSSVGCLVTTFLYFFYLKKRLSYLHGVSILKSLSKITFLAILSGVIIFIIFQKLNGFIITSPITFALFSRTFIIQTMKIVASALIGVVAFIVMSLLLKIEEADKICNLVKIKLQNILKIGYNKV